MSKRFISFGQRYHLTFVLPVSAGFVKHKLSSFTGTSLENNLLSERLWINYGKNYFNLPKFWKKITTFDLSKVSKLTIIIDLLKRSMEGISYIQLQKGHIHQMEGAGTPP